MLTEITKSQDEDVIGFDIEITPLQWISAPKRFGRPYYKATFFSTTYLAYQDGSWVIEGTTFAGKASEASSSAAMAAAERDHHFRVLAKISVAPRLASRVNSGRNRAMMAHRTLVTDDLHPGVIALRTATDHDFDFGSEATKPKPRFGEALYVFKKVFRLH